MKKRKLSPKREESAMAPIAIIAILVVGLMVIFAVAVAWASIADNANDPDEPPDGTDGQPSWYGRFVFSVEYDPDGIGADSVDIYQAFMGRLVEYEGQEWSTSSLRPAAWGWADSYEAKYWLTLTHDKWTVKDEGTFHVYKSEDFTEVGRETAKIHFWDEQVGSWKYRLKIEVEDTNDVKEGYFTLTSSGTIRTS
jgi:hypothetical protein